MTPADAEGAFPLLGPVTYLADDEMTARRLLRTSSFPVPSTWWHATYEYNLPRILTTGLVPGCWRGGDTCAVFGVDDHADVPMLRRDGWVLEIRSRALREPTKAWWVPAGAIRGARRGERFFSRSNLLSHVGDPHQGTDGCACPLANLCREQQSAWRATWG